MDTTINITHQLLINESGVVHDIIAVTISYLFTIFCAFLSVMIMCGNLLVIISIVYFKQLHTPTNYLMLSLAVADLLVGLFILPFSLVIIVSSNWSGNDLLCMFRNGLDMILSISSIWNLCCISVDRYYAVCQPLRYRSKITVRVVGIMILVSWSYAALTGFVFTFQAPDKGLLKKCVLFQNKPQSSVLLGVIFSFGLPSILLVAIYLKILLVAHRQARSIVNMSKSGVTLSKMERKATKTLAFVMGAFLMSWTPLFLCLSFNPWTKYTIPTSVLQSCKLLGWTNSMFNPCVYALFYKPFRSAFRMIITGKLFQRDCSHADLL